MLTRRWGAAFAPLPTGHAQAVIADFGRRPLRAAARPGIFPEQLSQRSACFAPRRASLYVTRITEPLPSSTPITLSLSESLSGWLAGRIE